MNNIFFKVLIIFLLFFSFEILPKEKIISFHSDITISNDASMLVKETIKVKAEGQNIKRGIYRDFPTRYKDHFGNNYVVDFKIIEILRDNVKDDYYTKNLSNGIRIYIGKKNFLLKPGIYTYTIVYKTNRQIGFFDDHDELYWNVTGNGWGFPIEQASAVINLPNGISSNQIKCYGYTGSLASNAADYVCSKLASTVKFLTTRPLASKQGLTIVVEFPKGFITKPSKAQQFSWFINDNLSIVLGIIGIILVSLFYTIIWFRVGKDPEKNTIIPQYTPPEKFSPAAMRYISKMSFDNKSFAAAVLNMAVKGYLKIKEEGGNFILIKGKIDESVLNIEEKKIASSLIFKNTSNSSNISTEQINELTDKMSGYSGMGSFFVKRISNYISNRIKEKANSKKLEPDEDVYELKLIQSNHTIIRKAIDSLENTLKNSYEKIYFVTNLKYFVIGLILSIIIVIISGFFTTGDQIAIIIWMVIWNGFVIYFLFMIFKKWRDVKSGGKIKFAAFGSAMFLTIFIIPFVGFAIAGFYFFADRSSLIIIIIFLCFGILNIVFYHLLKAPTLLGRKILDKIEGFRMYLSITEKDRLNLLHPPEKTPELFEKYLPYALALDVEQEWSEQFASVLNKVSVENKNYSPAWYSGNSWSSLGTQNFASSFGSSFSSAISSSSTAPGSSGGSGGSSGGGGGGGGGGGW